MLNDSSEMEYGLGALKKFWDDHGNQLVREDRSLPNRREISTNDIAEGINDVLRSIEARSIHRPCFVTCASHEGNSLSQWRAYANQGGFAIGIDSSRRLGVKTDRPLKRSPGVVASCVWKDVTYGDDSRGIKRALGDAIAMITLAFPEDAPLTPDLRRSLSEMFALEGALLHKHPAFEVERESRFAVSHPDLNEIASFRQGAYGLTRHVEIAAADQDVAEGDPEASPIVNTSGERLLPIRHIRIGPTSSSVSVESELRALLEAKGYRDVIVDHSRHPIRQGS